MIPNALRKHARMLVLSGLALTAAILPGQGAVAVAAPSDGFFHAGMNGAREVPGPGDIGASGDARITVDPVTGEICWDLTVRNIDGTVTAAHIHVGDRDVAGPVVQGLSAPVGGHSDGCATNSTLATQIVADPSGYYVNVHSTVYPAGAVRGQLAGPHN